MLVLATACVSANGAQARSTESPGMQCDQAIRAAARSNGNPAQLMAAIGLVESGRPEATGGAVRPWPWTINAEGKGLFFNSKTEAIAAVRVLQADNVHSIDVGCMQVNLMHHPTAFATLEEAFDPRRNALYAGQFLNQLFRHSQDWLTAAGLYHSATPGLAADYVKQVAAVLKVSKGRTAVWAGFEAPERETQPAAPVIGRDGTILPSMRLTPAGLLKASATETQRRKSQGNGWSEAAVRARFRGL